METIESIQRRIQAKVPGATIEIVPNEIPAGVASLLIDREHGRAVAEFLRDDPELTLDFCSNATGVDWPERVLKEKVKVRQVVDGEEKEVEEVRESKTPAYLESVYHLYSMSKKHGPVVIRMRTGNRTDEVTMPSLTPVWRSCEFQEREIFDLFGIRFEGHPDLRRILMWDEFKDFPMRKDYVEPDDYEYEPTPHDDVCDKASRHYPANQGAPT
jgi:NADH-quinone oxidoreductase subunit C